MEISEISRIFAKRAIQKAILQELREKSAGHIFLDGLRASGASLFFSSLFIEKLERSFLFILDDQEEAAYFYHDLTQVMGENNVLFFPSAYRRAAKYGQKDNASIILRTEIISRLSAIAEGQDNEALFVVTSPDALAEKVVSTGKFVKNSISIEVGESIDREILSELISDFGFERVDYVYEPGQYALRGSIIDIFSYSSEFPFRIDFFGDDIDSIRTFEVENQLSRELKKKITIVPDIKSDDVLSDSLLDYMPKNTVIAVKDLFLVKERIGFVHNEVNNKESVLLRTRAFESLNAGGQREDENSANQEHDSGPAILTANEYYNKATNFLQVEFGSKPSGTPNSVFRFDMSPQPLFHKNFDLVSATLSEYVSLGYKIFILTDSAKQAERLKTIFYERGDNISFIHIGKTLHEGFTDNQIRCCFFTDHQIFDRFHKYSLKSDKARGGKVALTLKELNEFEIGDYVVHIDYGVGRFGGLVRIPNGASTQEVIKIFYKNDDTVFVSIHALHKISKYKGREGTPAHINKLGTAAWDNLKERTKGKIKDIARDLIKLYALRLNEKGFSFSPDNFMQNELEASFIYEDTPDQLKATQDIKSDMERARPMDRLICGDVGFGKTEVAIRAAFKAVSDSKQVAVLVPTTILAFQHFMTFSERLKEFPCTVDYLSRARSSKEVSEILNGLKEGRIDVVIGTHRLIGKDVKFKDLGLLIIDEEQKFGVSVKEKLKQIKVNVDTLTMTATPIPRTLQFSLMGARDFSMIQTPPPNRYPIQTEVHVFSHDIIREAVNFEMSRNGQLFLVSNRISSLSDLAALVKREVPDCRVCIGHGQMNPDELESILMGFVNYDYDVLIATSIIENGIDIPNVNTIILNQAQNFGLSDLHQMRGRVGRGNKKAFCYLLAPPLSSLSQEARRRLQAIESFSELGSGIQLALQDLDIRGAGNLLGAEQSGFIADLGYETYQKILKEAIVELKTTEFSDLFTENDSDDGSDRSGKNYVDDCNVESDMELLFPNNYVPGSSERMLLYRELDSIETESGLNEFKKRMEDRFGKMPKPAEDLVRLVSLRCLGKKLCVEKIILKSGRMNLLFVNSQNSTYYDSDIFGAVISYVLENPKKCILREQESRRSMIVQDITDVEGANQVLSTIIKQGSAG